MSAEATRLALKLLESEVKTLPTEIAQLNKTLDAKRERLRYVLVNIPIYSERLKREEKFEEREALLQKVTEARKKVKRLEKKLSRVRR